MHDKVKTPLPPLQAAGRTCPCARMCVEKAAEKMTTRFAVDPSDRAHKVVGTGLLAPGESGECGLAKPRKGTSGALVSGWRGATLKKLA